jgi:thiamine-monophosphate kinase
MPSEFDLIRQFFTRQSKHAELGVGDDAALFQVSAGCQLAVSTDMLVAGTHFFHDAAPYDIGWKALAVNVSDMAAMGAQPKWATLAIALPETNEIWLAEFSRGFFACAEQFDVDLIGGDTTRGPLNISVTIMGEVPIGEALRRDDAKVGDDIWVSGYLGSAAAGLAHLQGKIMFEKDAQEASIHALHRPTPRLSLGLALRNIANSAIDISDGLAADLGHILDASNVGADVFIEKIPHLSSLQTTKNLTNDHADFKGYILSGGDDYELCFTAPETARSRIDALANTLNLPLARIGKISATKGLRVYDANKQLIPLDKKGFDHFA